MYTIEPTNNIPAVLYSRIEEYLRSSMRKVDNICRRNHISKAAADAMAEDMATLLQARYKPFTATQEHIAELVRNTTPATWDRTENPLLCVISRMYSDLYCHVEAITYLIGLEWAHPHEWCEIYRRQGKEVPQETFRNAQMQAYIYCVLCIGEMVGATQEELEQIQPYDSSIQVPADTRSRLIEKALQFRAIHMRLAEADEARKAEKAATGGDIIRDNKLIEIYEDTQSATHEHRTASTPRHTPIKAGATATAEGGKTIALYNNVILSLSRGLQTADITTNGQQEIMRPIWEAIEEKKQNAELLISDRRLHATPEQIQQAQNLIASMPAIYNAFRGIQILPQMILPDSGSTTIGTYRTTPRQFTIIATGTEKPNQTQIDNCMRALDFLSTQRMEVGEVVIKKVPEYDEEGKPKKDARGRTIYHKKPVQTYTRFNPCTTTFYGEYDDKAQATTAKQIVLHLDNIITQGRSAAYKHITEENGRTYPYPIEEPQVQRIPLWQVYQFTYDEEQRFQYALLAKPKRNEEDLLAEVFAYGKKQADAKAVEDAAAKRLRDIAANGASTQEEIAEAQAAYQRAKEAAADCITKNKSRDKDKLQAMFTKAQDIGLLKWWCKDEAAESTNSRRKRKAYVYRWCRFTDEEIKKHRRSKS